MSYKPFKQNSQYVIKGERGGVVPQELRGKYTKAFFAEQAIQAYENKVKNESTSSTGTASQKRAGAARKKASSGNRSQTEDVQ